MTQITLSSDTSSFFRHIYAAYRIDQLHSELYPVTEYTCQKLKNIWIAVVDQISKKTFTSFDELKINLTYLPPKIKDFYLHSIELNRTRLLAYVGTLHRDIETDLQSLLRENADALSGEPLEKTKTTLEGIWEKALNNIEAGTFSSFEETRLELKKLPRKVASFYTNSLNRNTNDPLIYAKQTFLHISENLKRILSEDNEALSIGNPEEILESLRTLWKRVSIRDLNSAAQPFTSYEEALNFIDTELEHFPPAIRKIYKRDLAYISTLQDVQAYASRYFKETRSATLPCIQATGEGKMGFPKIINYSITKSNKSIETFSCFFKYFNHSIEMDYHLLYRALVNGPFSCPEISDLFNVPQAIMLDLKQLQITHESGIKELLNPRLNERMQTIFTHFATTHTARNHPCNEEIKFQKEIQERPVALFPIISAPNLSDYVQRIGADLSPEMLKNLGMIAFIDLLGNRDRLINTILDEEGEKYVLSNQEEAPELCEGVLPCNLGNLMVDRDKIHLIDNSLGDGTLPEIWVSDEEDRLKYLTFLEELFAKPEPEKALADHFLKSLYKWISRLGEDGEDGEDQTNIQEHYRVLKENLQRADLTHFIAGMQEMKALLKSKIIPAWKSETSSAVKELFNPDLVSMIEERLDFFARTEQLSLIAATESIN